MTWYASQIITVGDPSILAAIKRDPLFADHAYWVTNPIHHNWHTPEVAHSIPPEGLVFIRPICDPTDHIAEWHDNDILSWERFDIASDTEIVLSPLVIAQKIPNFELPGFPPVSVLRVAKNLSLKTKIPVAFYYCFFWGGDAEIEYAWVFGNSERFIIRVTENVPPNINRLLEIDTDIDAINVYDDDVLVRTLRFLSCSLPTPFFAPHTRSFLWYQHRL